MKFTKKFDKAFQWAGERMGGEAKTTHSDEFKALEEEMSLRSNGMDSIHKSMNIYTRWLGRRCDALEDKSRRTPAAMLGRNMAAHGEDFEQDSELGNCLVAFGQANERIAELQASYLDQANASWVQQIDRNVAMLKEYQTSRKKLESRRLAYDATIVKMEKGKQDEFRVEDELRANRAKFEESTEDVFRRMQDIKDAEVESTAELGLFLDAEMDYHERAAAELRRARASWTGMHRDTRVARENREPSRSRSNTARSWQAPRQSAVMEEPDDMFAVARRRQISSANEYEERSPPQKPPRPSVIRATTLEVRPASSIRGREAMAPLTRTVTDTGAYGRRGEDIFADDDSVDSGGKSPDGAYRSTSPATSYGSMSRSTSALGGKRPPLPPPPPINRSKKPPPPPVPRKINLGY